MGVIMVTLGCIVITRLSRVSCSLLVVSNSVPGVPLDHAVVTRDLEPRGQGVAAITSERRDGLDPWMSLMVPP